MSKGFQTGACLREMADEERMNNIPSDSEQKVHQIRLVSIYFDDVCSGKKSFELQKNDRHYKVGDIIEMMEFADGKNTGRSVRVLVTYLLEDYPGIEDGYCIMATLLMNDDGKPYDKVDIEQICADIEANGDGCTYDGDEYIIVEKR
jgi:ParB family chromosome partitioning protein